MDCQEAQEIVLESFDNVLSHNNKRDLDLHLSLCAGCAHFAQLQNTLDYKLSAAICAPRLSPSFQAVVRTRISSQQQALWPDWLPDVAYLAGSIAAIGLCVVILPFSVAATISTGAGLALATYFLQTELAGSLEELEEAG